MCLFGGSWAIDKAFQLSVMDINWQDYYFVKSTYIFGTIAPFAYLMLAYNFPYRVRAYSKKLFYLIYSIPAVLIILVILGILKKNDSFIINNTLVREVNLIDFSIFAVYFFLYVFCGFFILLKKYLSAQGVNKLQIKYLMIATIGTFMTTGFLSVILPWFNIFTYDWLGAVFLLIHFGFVGYWIFIKNR